MRGLVHGLHVMWPILWGILLLQLALGSLITLIEQWPLGDGAYFTFITGLTIGYGDLVPHYFWSRFLAIVIGFSGTVLTGLIAAVAVQALHMASPFRADSPS